MNNNMLPTSFHIDETNSMIGMCEAVQRKNPYDIDILIILGHFYTQTGDYERGLETDITLSILCPDDQTVWYNLSCSYSLLEYTNKALDALQKAIDCGYNDIVHLSHDSDLDNIRTHAQYKEIIMQLIGKETTQTKH